MGYSIFLSVRHPAVVDCWRLHTTAKSRKENNSQPCVGDWSLLDGFYFCMVTLTTVGKLGLHQSTAQFLTRVGVLGTAIMILQNALASLQSFVACLGGRAALCFSKILKVWRPQPVHVTHLPGIGHDFHLDKCFGSALDAIGPHKPLFVVMYADPEPNVKVLWFNLLALSHHD